MRAKYNYGEIVSRLNRAYVSALLQKTHKEKITPMKVLVIGGGGREHAILWALANTSATPLDLSTAHRATGESPKSRNASRFP